MPPIGVDAVHHRTEYQQCLRPRQRVAVMRVPIVALVKEFRALKREV
jgi:hypothetical protein